MNPVLIQIAINLAAAYGLVMACVLILWVISVRIRDVSIIDMFWGAGFALIAVMLWAINRPQTVYAMALAALPALWALRYTFYILRRNWGHGEDARYAKLRTWVTAGDASFARFSLTRVFLLQGHIMVIVALPVIVALAMDGPPALPALLWLGTGVWLAGVVIEALADAQLAAFRKDKANRGQVLDRGLWAWSRHPNYFGNALLWWGIFIAACAHPVAAVTVIGPVVMTHFLVNVTGMRTLDKKLAREKPGYGAYMARTSGFIPRPPRPQQ
jgi:steroid 5-alpha reductase family enzyme